MTLNARGIIAVVELVIYIPIFCFTLFLVIRHGFKREAGWVFLLVVSIIRLLGATMLIVAESLKTPSISTYVAAFVLEATGLSPLLLATLSFLGVVGEHSLGDLPLSSNRIWRLIRLALLTGLILAIVGGSSSSSSERVSMRKAGSLVYAGVYIILFSMHALFWTRKSLILRHRRTLLIGISAALPFLFLRVLYTVLSSFSGTSFGGTSTTTNSLAKFSSVSGEWQIYLVMSLIMELAVVIIYCTVGTLIPLQTEEDARKSEEHELHGSRIG